MICGKSPGILAVALMLLLSTMGTTATVAGQPATPPEAPPAAQSASEAAPPAAPEAAPSEGAAQPAPAAPSDAAPHAAAADAKPVVPDGARPIQAGRFGTVMVYSPSGPPKSAAIFISGDGGWKLGVLSMAKALVRQGALVIGVDIRQYQHSLAAASRGENAPCQMMGQDFEALSHRVQKQMGLTEYHVPVLVGYSSGATFVYGVLVQAPAGTFAGAMSLGFGPDENFAGATLCPGTGPGLRYTHGKNNVLILEAAPALKPHWVLLQGQKDQVCDPALVDAFAAKIPSARVERLPLVGHGFGVEKNWMPQFLAAYLELVPHPAPAGSEASGPVGDLPLNEVQGEAQGQSAPELAILVTGDGGWAGLDQELAAHLATKGVPTVALNSLKYFWSPKKPQQLADDLARIMRHYLTGWHKERVLLVGYSFGADVLPFAVRRLPEDLRNRVATLSLMGLDETASFEISISDWLGTDTQGPPTRPELASLGALPVLCIYGEGEHDSLCPTLKTAALKREQIGRGHHFSGEYGQLAERILAFARASQAHG